MLRHLTALIGCLVSGGCCSSLPDVPQRAQSALDVARTLKPRTQAFDWHDPKRNRVVPLKIFGDDGPIVIVSHGIGEDRDSYEYLGRALASNGFMAVHITHAGTDRAMLDRGYLALYRATKEKQNWVNRPLDVSFVLDELTKMRGGDLGPVAVAGHSAGAFTAFAVAGMKPNEGETLRDERVRAIVPMSMPRLDGVVAPDGYDEVRVPTLNITGTCDTSLIYRTYPHHRRIPFEQTHAANHWLLTIRGVTHNSFSNPKDENHDVISSLVVAFLRAELLGDEASRRFFEQPGRTELNGKELTIERK